MLHLVYTWDAWGLENKGAARGRREERVERRKETDARH
jgi:hypothetical protein